MTITHEIKLDGAAVAQSIRGASVAEARAFLRDLLSDLVADHYLFARDHIAAHPIASVACPRCTRHTVALSVGAEAERRCEHCLAKLGAAS